MHARYYDEYGGAFLADVVGLGKIFMSALLSHYLNEPCLVIAPPHLLEEHNLSSWPNVFREFGVRGFLCESLGKLESMLRRDLSRSRPFSLMNPIDSVRRPLRATKCSPRFAVGNVWS